MLIGYQSLNSSSSSDHGASSTADQNFANLTHRNAYKSVSDMSDPDAMDFVLEYPQGDDTNAIYAGPSALKKTARPNAVARGEHTGAQLVTNVTAKAEQFRQIAGRIPDATGSGNGSLLDLMVLGEIDTSHPDWQSIHKLLGQPLGAPDHGTKTCQAFSVHPRSTSTKILGQDTGWVAVELASRMIVFVHVPNSIAKSRNCVTEFYKKIISKVGRLPDLVMGDTNQRTKGFTEECLNASYQNMNYATIDPGSTIHASDVYGREHVGTNSNGKMMYDVAVYSKAHFGIAPTMAYVSQFGVDKSKPVARQHVGGYEYIDHEVVALTDHMGMIVHYP